MRWNCYRLDKEIKAKVWLDGAYLPGGLIDKALMFCDSTGFTYIVVGPSDEGHKVVLVTGAGLGSPAALSVVTRETEGGFDAVHGLNGWVTVGGGQ